MMVVSSMRIRKMAWKALPVMELEMARARSGSAVSLEVQ